MNSEKNTPNGSVHILIQKRELALASLAQKISSELYAAIAKKLLYERTSLIEMSNATQSEAIARQIQHPLPKEYFLQKRFERTLL
jgi:hypothetical protein